MSKEYRTKAGYANESTFFNEENTPGDERPLNTLQNNKTNYDKLLQTLNQQLAQLEARTQAQVITSQIWYQRGSSDMVLSGEAIRALVGGVQRPVSQATQKAASVLPVEEPAVSSVRPLVNIGGALNKSRSRT